MSALDAALKYAARGWRVFPVRGSAPPERWPEIATTDGAQIRAWWDSHPSAKVAIATGSGSRLLVVDLDRKNGKDGVAAFYRDVAPNDTYEHRGPRAQTKSGGVHLYYETSDDYRNTAGRLGDGIDTRGNGGFVFAPGTEGYEWLDFSDAYVPPVPEWLSGLLAPSTGSTATPTTAGSVSGRSTLTALLSTPPGEGERNNWLAQVAGHYAKQFARQRDTYEWHVANAVTLMADPLPFSEFARTLESIWDAEQAKPADAFEDDGEEFTLVSLAGIQMRPVKWTWGESKGSGGRIPLGSLSLLGGREGVGKSTIVWDLTAALSRGKLPGEYFGSPVSTFVVATEDSYEHTIAPRLKAADADLNRVYRMDPAKAKHNVTLPADMERLERAVKAQGVRFVVLDPLMSRLGKLDTHKDSDVRVALEPLSDFADRSGAAVVGLIHVNKTATFDPLTSLMGSRAFTAVARSVLFTMYDPDTDGVRLLCHAKCNLGPLVSTLRYGIEEVTVGETSEGTVKASHIKWGGEDDRNGRDLLEAAGAAKSARKATKADEVADWLGAYLRDAGGSARGPDVKVAAMAAGFSERTLQRACKTLDVSIERGKAGGVAKWTLGEF